MEIFMDDFLVYGSNFENCLENERADALAKLATTPQEDLDRLISVEHLTKPSVNVDDEEVSPLMYEPSWMDPIWDYLVDRTLPSDPKEASKLRTRSKRFTIHRGTLYKRGFSTPILKCVGKEDANYVLGEVHEGVCGNHIAPRTLAAKTLRHMQEDAPKPSLGELLKFTSVGRKMMKEKGNYADGESGIYVIYNLNPPIIYPITQD